MNLSFTGQLSLRVPPELRGKLEEQAAAKGQKLSDYVRVILHERAQGTAPGQVVHFARRTEDPGAAKQA